MASGSAGRLRPLFVVSRDFGEFTRAFYFAQEPEFDSCLLVRPSLSATLGDDLPVPSQRYESIADIRAAVERFQPDAVFLFSGYLFAHDAIFSYDDLDQLIQTLHRRGCPVFTSDPFFGWLRELTASMPDTAEPTRAWAGLPSPPSVLAAELEEEQKRCFVRDFGRAAAVLQAVPHVYDLYPPQGFVSDPALIYSNQGMTVLPGQVPGWSEVRQALRLDPARPRWVFVVAGEDYGRLTNIEDSPAAAVFRERAAQFHELLADQMYEVLAQGRQPILIAPPACITEVTLRSNPADGIILLPACRHSWFVALVLEAEYAFYWHMFSNSLKLRIVNQRPFFFSNLGHIGQSSPLLLQRMAQCYYVAGMPPCLDFSQPLDADELARAAAEQEPMLRAMADHLLRPPRPAEALRQFLQGRTSP